MQILKIATKTRSYIFFSKLYDMKTIFKGRHCKIKVTVLAPDQRRQSSVSILWFGSSSGSASSAFAV